MKKLLFTLLRMLLFLLVLFATMRIVFLAKYWTLVRMEEIPFAEISAADLTLPTWNIALFEVNVFPKSLSDSITTLFLL